MSKSYKLTNGEWEWGIEGIEWYIYNMNVRTRIQHRRTPDMYVHIQNVLSLYVNTMSNVFQIQKTYIAPLYQFQRDIELYVNINDDEFVGFVVLFDFEGIKYSTGNMLNEMISYRFLLIFFLDKL